MNDEMITNSMNRTLIILTCLILLAGCLKEDPLNRPFETFQPVQIGDGLSISGPSAENMDSLMLFDIYRDVHGDDNLWSIRSLLVFRHGKLVAEAYFKDGADITTRHLIWSATKQVLAIVTGLALDKGLIASVDDPISDYFTTELEGHPDKSYITIRNLLTMMSGIGYNNDGAGGETDKMLRQIPDNSVDFVLSLPLRAPPGTEFHYNDGTPHLLSALIQKRAGMPTDAWADSVLFSKIGFRNYKWVRYKDGITHGGYGIETTPREFARLALLVADSGRWNNEQYIPANWIKSMTSVQVEETSHDYKMGFYWWKDIAHDISFMNGHGGQYAFVIPSHDMVVVITAIPNTQDDYQITLEEAMPYVYRIMNSALD